MKMNKILLFTLLGALLFTSACNDDDEPEIENEEEIITDVTLSFAPATGAAIEAKAMDPDGEGFADIQVLDTIRLKANTTYTLSIDLLNAIANESITEEVEEEADEHLFLFSWTNEVFANPTGNGNIDNRADAVNYLDSDMANLPLGLSTSWTSGDIGMGVFRVVLKHQPDIKSATSGATDGESDVDLTWVIEIVD